MALAYADALQTARLAEIATAIDFATGAGKIKIYDGAQPAKGGTATTLLAELTFQTACTDTNTGGVLTFDTINSDTSANATGTATWFRITDGDDAFVMDGTVGTSGADLNLNSTSIDAGQTVEITSWTITEGNG
jgi:hypothetical protein